MKIIWLSANKFGYELLKFILKSKLAHVSSLITLHPNSSTIMYDGVQIDKWNKLNIDIHQVKNINQEEKLLSKLNPDLIIMCGWRQVVKKSIYDIPNQGFIGFHPTLLPFGRGPAPIINSILNNISKSGVTMFHLGEGIDDGDIIAQEKFSIVKTDHSYHVYNKVIKAGKKIVAKYIPLIIQNKAPRKPQNHEEAVFFEKLKISNNQISLTKDSLATIDMKIRAFSKPYLGAYVIKNGKKIIFWKSSLSDGD